MLKGDVVDEVRRLKEQIDGVILVAGSSQLVHSLIEHDLVDELRLMVHPVVLGSGERLFGETDDLKRLRLADSQVMGEVAVLTYQATASTVSEDGSSKGPPHVPRPSLQDGHQ